MNFYFLTAIALTACFTSNCQDIPFGVFVSSGGSAQIEETYLSWTVGEPFVGTLSSENGSLSQGFSLESTPTLTAVENSEFEPSMKVYPNPAANFIAVEFLGTSRSYQLRVLDALGRVRLSEMTAGYNKKDFGHFTSLEWGVLRASERL